MYQRKAKKAIREQIKNEDNLASDEMGRGLLPKKKNIDLKRNLTNKMDQLNLMTEKAIYEIISMICLAWIINLGDKVNKK